MYHAWYHVRKDAWPRPEARRITTRTPEQRHTSHTSHSGVDDTAEFARPFGGPVLAEGFRSDASRGSERSDKLPCGVWPKVLRGARAPYP